MSNENNHDAEAWKYAQQAMTWYGWGSPVYRPIHRRHRSIRGIAACRGSDPMTAHPSKQSIIDATPARFHVVIIGGGIGGLTLAQGLKKSGVSVAVYERDRTRTDRVQGYRVHINPTGSLALRECLPQHLFEAFIRTCGKPSGAIRFMTEQMKPLLTLSFATSPEQAGDEAAKHRSVSRISLRQVLLSGLDDVVHFDKTFVRYEEGPAGRIVAHFEDGSSAEGDVLIAADGGGSRVRRQYLPQRNASTPALSELRAKFFWMRKAGGKSRRRCRKVSRLSPAWVAAASSWRRRRSTAWPAMTSAATMNPSKPAATSTTRAVI